MLREPVVHRGEAPGSYDALLGGLHTRPALISHPGRQAGIQLSPSPFGARTLLGVPAGELASLDCPVGDVLGRDGAEPVERVRVADVAARVGWSDRHLGARFRADTGLSPEEAARVVRFDRARRALADQAHLTREWRAVSGLPPTRWLAAEVGFVQDRTAPGAGGWGA
jgi:AraC-like DNA-binding protein